MTSVAVRFEELTASHWFELQSETKDDHQQSRKLRKCLSRNRKGFYFKSLNLKKASSTKTINNRGNIIQLQKETAYLPPSCSLLRETIVKILNNTQSAWSAQSAAVGSLHGPRFNMTVLCTVRHR